MVTLDGTLINKAGLMTGGSSAGEAARASRWNQKEHEGLKQAEAMARRELERIGDVHTMSEAVASARHAYETTMQELENAKADRQVTAAKEAKHRKQLETLDKTRGQTEKRLADAEAKQARAPSSFGSHLPRMANNVLTWQPPVSFGRRRSSRRFASSRRSATSRRTQPSRATPPHTPQSLHRRPPALAGGQDLRGILEEPRPQVRPRVRG